MGVRGHRYFIDDTGIDWLQALTGNRWNDVLL